MMQAFTAPLPSSSDLTAPIIGTYLVHRELAMLGAARTHLADRPIGTSASNERPAIVGGPGQ